MKRIGKRVRRSLARRAVAVTIHPLLVAGENDAKWFPQASPVEAGNGHAERLLLAMLGGYPEFYRLTYGEMSPVIN